MIKKNNSKETSLNSILGKVLIFVVFLLLGAFLIREVSSFDVWFHLKAGQWIISNKSAPVLDMFSYTASGNHYLDSHWLFQVVLYLFYQLGGIAGIQLLKIVVFLFSFYCLFKFADKKDYITAAMFIFISVLLVQERFFIRPEMPTILFLGLYLLILRDYKYSNTGAIWLLPLMQLIWANMHGLFILGLLIVLATLIGEFLAGYLKLKDDNIIRGSKYKKLMLVLLAMIVVCLINPYGIKGALYPFLLFTEIGEGANVWMKTVGELQPSMAMSGDSPIKFYYIIMIVLAGLSFTMNIKKINPAYLMLYLGFLYISLKARRNIALFAFVAAPIAISNIKHGEGKVVEFLDKHRKIIETKRTILALIMIVLSVIWIINLATSNYYIKKNDAKRFGLSKSVSLYPEKAVDFIIANNIKGNMLNANSIGGYLVWRLTPARKVFVDGRWEVYGSEFMDSYKTALTDLAAFNELAGKYDINYIIFNHISMESRRLLKGLHEDWRWKLIYFDDIASIFIRNSLNNKELIERNRINPENLLREPVKNRRLFQYNNFMKGSFFYSIGEYRNAESEFRQAVIIKPDYYEAYNNLGNSYQMMKKYESAINAYRKVLELKPDYISTRINLAGLYGLSQKYDMAEEEYRRIIELSPGNPDSHYELAVLYKKQKKSELYLNELEEVLKVVPDHFKAHYDLAIAYNKSDIDRTIKELKETIRIKPEFGLGHYNLGIAYSKTGRREKAVYHWEQYLNLNPDDANAQAVINWINKHSGQDK